MISHFKILVNADDFGRHVLINRAVAEAVTRGILRSATLMPGGVAFDDAVEIARTHPALGVGIHLTLVNGNPVCNPKDIPSLVDETGHFYDNHGIFVKRYFAGKISREDIRRELFAQVQKMQKTGLPLTHIDSHQHMHMLPGVIDIALLAAESVGLSATRISLSPLFTGFSGNPAQLIGRAGLWTLATLAKKRAKAKHFRMPDHFAGIVAGDAVTPTHLRKIIGHLQPGTTEIMMHPGTDNETLIPDTAWDHDFEAEFAAMTSPEIAKLLEEKGIETVNYNELEL